MWAHSGDGNGRWHRLSAHARSTASLSARFAREFGAEDLGYALGLFHDAGKAAPCWQEGLAGVADTGKAAGVPHKEAGAGWLAGSIGPVSLAILGHHGGLSSAGELTDKLEALNAGAFGDLEKIQAGFVREVPEAQEVLQHRGLVPQLWQQDPLLCELAVRMAFSTLVDADHLDTAALFAGREAPRVRADADMVALTALFEQQR